MVTPLAPPPGVQRYHTFMAAMKLSTMTSRTWNPLPASFSRIVTACVETMRGHRPVDKALKKVPRSREIAFASGIEWIWIGICCVDWSSRVKMNEAHNLSYE
jgi:hypothetical protein